MNRFALSIVIILLAILMNFSVVGQSSGFKVRALWADPSGFGSAKDVDEMISKCQRSGINTILPDVMLGDNVYFKSKKFIGHVAANDLFDPLEYMIKKAHAVGIKVQAWSCVYYTKPLKPEWISQSFDRNANGQTFLSPANPEVNPYLISVIKEMLAYDIDGIHLDYCRYCNAAYDYSDAARKGCQAQLGFDPLNFIDHPELIVPAKNDPYPIRVLHPKTSIDRVWESGVVERNLNRAGVGFALISENTQNIDALRVPGLLIISHYTDVTPEMSTAITRYVNRGGNLLWIDPSNGVFMKNLELQKLTGVSGTQTFAKRVTLQNTGNDALADAIPSEEINTSGNILKVDNATILAKFSTGEPIITINQVGRDARRASKVMVIGLRAMESNDDSVILMLRGIMYWYRTQAGIEAPDLLAQKRNQWIKWRADQIIPLVREISRAVKAKDPKLVLTSSAGVGPQQYCGVYRDGAYWLTEKINDCLFPMNYTTDPVELDEMLQEQASRTPQGMSDHIFPGLRIYGKSKASPSLDADNVEKQMTLVQQKGYQGYCLFATKYLSEDLIRVAGKFSK